jgi:hypothetical protein
MNEDITTLDQYLLKYSSLLGEQAQRSLHPLHNPIQDQNHPQLKTLLRKPYPPQAIVITAATKSLNRQKSLFVVGECGTGKTLMGQATIHCHANGKPYRALVFCPGQLVRKWKREIEQTIPGCYVKIIERCGDVLEIASYGPPQVPEWYVIGRETAKLGPGFRGAAVEREVQFTSELAGEDDTPDTKRITILCCPKCGIPLRKVSDKDPVGTPVTMADLNKKRMRCTGFVTKADGTHKPCAEPLWQHIRKPDRFEPAKFIHKHIPLDYLVVDEVHEEKGADTAQANAVGSLAAASKKVIALTGTLIGGYAEHLRPLLFRLSPQTLIGEGFSWSDSMPFNEKYGRIEVRITETTGGDDNRQSRGSTSKSKYCRPGIMPTLFGRHLIGNAVFLGLSEMNAALPTLREFVVPIPMDPELALAYDEVETALREAARKMLARRDKRLLGTMLQTLMAYPDHPFGWEGVGYASRAGFEKVCDPRNLATEVIRAKERWFINLAQQEASLGRQVWGYVLLNGKRDVESRLAGLLKDSGLNVKVLKQSIPLAQREEWIDKNCRDVDVVLSHPRLVETGLDLFSKNYLGHNFCTLAFYETGYVLPTMRQASRRAWRLMQHKECKVYYGYYEGTMQEKAMQLMGKKLLAAEALEGKFSSEGLVAMAGDDGIEMALAKGLAETMDERVDRSWQQALDDGQRRSKSRSKPRRELVVIE